MKIGIIGDVHMGSGYSLGKTDVNTQLNSRLLDFSNTFDTIIDNFEKEKVSLVVITGDVFETRHPTSAQLNAFSKCVYRANSKGMKVLILAGNHDQQRSICTTTVDIFKHLNLTDVMVFTDIDIYTTEDKSADIVFLPYRDRRMFGVSSNAEAVAKIRNSINSIAMRPNTTKILFGHFMVGKAVFGIDGESFSMSEIILPLNLFKKFNAVAMGHVHRHEILYKDDKQIILYSGSMDKISFGERTHKKVSIILDTDNITNPKIIESPTRNLYEINLDYADSEKLYKHQITEKMLLDIEEFNDKFILKDAIVKFIAKVKENDLYYVNQEKIREVIMSKNVSHLTPLHVTAAAQRKLRNKEITETANGKKAIASFIRELNEPEHIKKKLLKFANGIIEEIEGK